jgi:tetratricopeptide (TPR) repeat protein
MEAYDKASKENVKDVNCPLNMAEILFKTGDFEKALEILEKAKELAPENIKILFSIAKCKSELCNVDNKDECEAIIDEFNKLSGKEDLPKDFDISIAKLYAKTGQIDEAFYHCKNAAENNEENIEAYKLLGLMQILKKDFSGAKNSLSVALNFQSNNDEIHSLFSYLLCSHEDGCVMQKCRQKYYDLIRKQNSNQQQ